MRKIALSIVLIITMASCDTLKNVNTSSVINAATMLGSLSSNSTVQQITSLFGLLDTNKDNAISSTEAIGSVAENFNILDKDKSSDLNLSELQGLLGLLK
jgi:hypothetical protein